MMLFTHNDVITLLITILVLPCLGVIFSRLINFIPSLIKSVLKSTKNPSI
jgi:hypothetical protein